MSKSEPTIQKFMTCQPYSIESMRNVHEAQHLMAEHKIRHLPVMKGEKVIGIVSERDIQVAKSMVGSDMDSMTVRDICHLDPYLVEPDTLLSDVAREMAANHQGSAIVLQNGKLVGIFTTVDACRAIAELMEKRYHSHGG